MGTVARCLCLILTLSMAGSRPSAGFWSGSPDSDPWWGTQDAKDIKRALERFRYSGDYVALERSAERGYRLALDFGSRVPAVRYLINAGSARMLQYRYRAALEAYLEAQKLAASIHDDVDEGAILTNLSSLYYEMSDTAASLEYAEQAQSKLHGHPYFEYQLLLQRGKLYALVGDRRAAPVLGQEIEAARAHADPRQEARGWDYLGDLGLRSGDLNDADSAFSEAFRIRKLLFPADLPYSYARLGGLRLAQHRLDEAERFTDLAIAADSAFPRFLLIHQRGEIRLARGDQASALSDFAQSAELARQWRQEVLPAISTLTESNVALEKEVFDSLIDLAAAQGKPEQAFAAVEENRAVTLRVSGWQKRLPRRYWDVLGDLRSEETRLTRTTARDSSALEKFRTELTEMEAEAGLRIFSKKVENFPPRKTLNHFQRVLSANDLFLGFHLGKTASYSWALTAESLTMHRLAPADEIRALAAGFRDSVRDGRPEAAEQGERLYRELFGWLGREQNATHDWMIAADDALYEVPFAALVTERKTGLKFLIEEHSLRLVPGAWSLANGPLTEAESRPAGEWLGVGDPIYNTADVRRSHPRYSLGWTVSASTGQLTRLAASAGEVRSSAQSWGAHTTLLEGADATLEKFQAAVARHPAVIHLATHVVSPVDRPGDSLIAFGLDRSGQPQFLSTADVAMMRVPGAIVTMTGCASGTGEIREGAGLLGLTRAWQLAGASSVIATLWPVPDSRGELFKSFYRHLRQFPTARAMRQSQIEMIHSGTWRAEPRYWASYQIFDQGGAR